MALRDRLAIIVNRTSQFSLGLRAKFLLSLVLTTVGLSFATLLTVRHATENHARQEIIADTGSSLMTFQVLLRENDVALRRKADLLATMAAMTDDDDTALQGSSDNALEADGSDLVVLADRKNQVKALHATRGSVTVPALQALLVKSLSHKSVSDWWYVNNVLYQVVLQPIDRSPHPDYSEMGTVAVGRAINRNMVQDLGRITASQVAFTYGTDIAATTLNVFDKYEFASHLGSANAPGDIQIGNERFYARYLQLTDSSEPNVRLAVLKSYSETAAFLAALNRLHLALGLIALLGGTALAVVLSGKFTKPIANLDKGVQALERGDFAFPLETEGRSDEVAHLTRAFDQMRGTLQRNETQKQQLEDQLRQSQKMEALGRLAGGVAHDFNNLLTIIKGHSDLMLERMNPADPLSKSGEQIRKAADRAASLTRQMLAFSRRQALQFTVVDLNFVVADMSKLLKRLIREDIEVVIRAGESLGRVKADIGQIEQVILNLVVNACDAMPNGGRLLVETQNLIVGEQYEGGAAIEPGQYVVLSVTDTGHGMDDEIKARIFEPFFTTKEEGKGTGLGLATVYGVVKQSGGFICVDTAPGKGAKFSIYLPRVEQNVEPRKFEKVGNSWSVAGATVLLAEDERELSALAQEFLTAAGYHVLTASDGKKALEIAAKHTEPIDLLLTDVVMPKMRGPELAKRIRSFHPNVKVVYMSGYLEETGGTDFLEGAAFLQKPFSRHALVNQVGSALSGESEAKSYHIDSKHASLILAQS